MVKMLKKRYRAKLSSLLNLMGISSSLFRKNIRRRLGMFDTILFTVLMVYIYCQVFHLGFHYGNLFICFRTDMKIIFIYYLNQKPELVFNE